jgi:hypothetical protein
VSEPVIIFDLYRKQDCWRSRMGGFTIRMVSRGDRQMFHLWSSRGEKPVARCSTLGEAEELANDIAANGRKVP